jgi:hypothetical protein
MRWEVSCKVSQSHACRVLGHLLTSTQTNIRKATQELDIMVVMNISMKPRGCASDEHSKPFG